MKKVITQIGINITLEIVDTGFLPRAIQKRECYNFEFKISGIKLKTSSLELNRIYFKKDSSRYYWWLRSELSRNRENGLRHTNFEHLTPNI